jgi:hypothetical protein
MKTLKNVLLLAGTMAALSFGAANVKAQGNFDPQQMRERMMERVREQLGVTNDDDWKIISDRAEKVMTARREASAGGFGMFGRGPGGGGGGRRGGGGGDNANANANGNGGNGGNGGDRANRGRGFFGEEPQEAKDLRVAIEAKAPADEIKTKLDKYRAYKKGKEADLVKAQEKLKEVLNARQEAAAVLAGLLQ